MLITHWNSSLLRPSLSSSSSFSSPSPATPLPFSLLFRLGKKLKRSLCSVVFIVQETGKKKQLKVKMQMAKFLQETIEEMAVSSKNPNKKESVQEFARFFEKVCS